MLQDPLDLLLLIVIDHNRWGVGLHPIILIGLKKSHVEDMVDSLQCLLLAPSSALQVVGSLPYALRNSEGANIPIMQFPGALQSQASSA